VRARRASDSTFDVRHLFPANLTRDEERAASSRAREHRDELLGTRRAAAPVSARRPQRAQGSVKADAVACGRGARSAATRLAADGETEAALARPPLAAWRKAES
jgi:hypothetical protein